MSSGLLGALSAAVSGLDAQSTNLSIEANNIANANTPGYKQTEIEFQTLVTGISSDTSFSPGGVAANNRQLVAQQGLLQSSSSSTDLAIQGNGLFVVNQKADASGQVLFTRAGSFTQDSSGNFVNAAGYYLQAWPLSRNGLLPGAPGNTTDTTSSANLSSLQTVNVESVAGTASATTNASFGINLDASETAYTGAGATAAMDRQDSTNFDITANTIIVPTSTDNLTVNDQMVITTGDNPTGYTFTYGGFVYSRSITQATGASDYGSSNQSTTAAEPSISLAAHGFTFTPSSNLVTINQAPPAGLQTGDIIKISGNTTAFDGLAAGALDGNFYVENVPAGASPSSFTIELAPTATLPSAVALATDSITNVSSGSNTLTIMGVPPTGLVTGDTVTLSGSGDILDSAGTTMYSAAQVNTTHTVMSINPGVSYTVSMGATIAGGGTQATGNISFAANPSNNDTISLNDQTWTFVTGAPGANQTQIQGTLSATLAQLQSDLTAAATGGNTHLNVATYGVSPASPNSTELTITSTSNSATGNSYTLGAPTVAATQNLAGGANGTSATGSVNFGGVPTNGQNITLDGTTWTFVTDTGQDNATLAAANDFAIKAGDLPGTMAAAAAVLSSLNFSGHAFGGAGYTYVGTATAIDITAPATDGAAPNSSYSLAVGSAASGVSGADLSGGIDGVQATGTIPITANPGAGETININGTTWTFVASGASGNQTNIQGTLANTLTQLAIDLNASGATNTNASYDGSSGNSLVISYSTTGVAGNGFTFKDASAGDSGANLTGGATTTNSGGSSTQGGASAAQFVTTGGTLNSVLNSRLFSGFVLDANNATSPLITTPGNFSTAALSFTIAVGSATPYTFTYDATAQNAAAGTFDTMTNLVTAINTQANGVLTARIVNNQLYIAAVDGSKSVVFGNGSTTGSAAVGTTPAQAGINWIAELGLANVGSATNRFSSLQGLADAINASSTTGSTVGISATVANASGDASLTITNNDPLDTITFTDGATNPGGGSVLAQLGLTSTLGVQTVPLTTGSLGPAYIPTNSSKNMASGAITPQFSRPVTVYDSLGTAHNLNVSFIKTGTNAWAVEVYSQPASDVNSTLPNGMIAYGTLQFNGDGSLASISPLLSNAIPIAWNDGAVDSSIAINWGTAGGTGVGKTDGISQFNGNGQFAVNFVNQNGTPVGDLTGLSIGDTGIITASFSNGQTEELYQIPLAIFSDPDELQAAAGNAYSQTANSGQVNLQQAGNSGVGTISSSSLEQSNVELADQLTQMIVAQRAYEANTKVISTADNLLQALDQIIQ